MGYEIIGCLTLGSRHRPQIITIIIIIVIIIISKSSTKIQASVEKPLS